jgi:MoaA/NifB/PqqE/SkfB family radical SAM enzyme
MFFKPQTTINLAKSLTRIGNNPAYVQFYITSRCNLTCKQCNIIYANASVREATTDEIRAIAKNLAEIGTGIVLLTGGEPFLRKDLPEIVSAFVQEGVHVRTQTNGVATRDQLEAVVAAGAKDISISLDSLSGGRQDFLNGSYRESWQRAIKTISLVTQTYPEKGGFAAFGTVLSPQNILEIPNIIRFASAIGWYVSLVPAHIADPATAHNFRSYDREMIFPPAHYPVVEEILDECLALKRAGALLYDSGEYIQNMKDFITQKPLRWRRRNQGRCDSPELYFAIRPNGDIQPCCDHVLEQSYPTWHADFPDWYRQREIHKAVHPYTEMCSGCMYGSYPEISITSHFPWTAVERLSVFWKTRESKSWPLSESDLYSIIDRINSDHPVDTTRASAIVEDVGRHADVTSPFIPIQISPPRRP